MAFSLFQHNLRFVLLVLFRDVISGVVFKDVMLLTVSFFDNKFLMSSHLQISLMPHKHYHKIVMYQSHTDPPTALMHMMPLRQIVLKMVGYLIAVQHIMLPMILINLFFTPRMMVRKNLSSEMVWVYP